MRPPAVSPEKFATFGDLLKYLRKREELTQREFAILVGYSDTQISRLEQNQRVPNAATLMALFVPALHIEREPQWVERLLELAQQARSGDLPVTTTLTPTNLPTSLTTFIGREKEQAEILLLIATHRLVTLTGSGGVGKTRISLKVGGQVLEEYPDGVWLAELAPLNDPERLAQTVASVFGIDRQSTTTSHTQLLINFLRSKTALLILDNCEHLMDASAFLADMLLKHCSQLKILATSREALSILGEIVYRMPSLRLPDIQQTLEHFREFESVRLFEERAQLAQPDFKLTMENASSVAQICSRLDGIPLAIELAAARVNMFSTVQIAARLDDRFHLLTSGSRTALPRQQTLRASIDWSWNLLSNPERTLLRRLTVFAGGWTLEAAETVCIGKGTADGSVEPREVSELMTQLVAKSLVVVDRQPGRERRFRLHETIRQYAHEKLFKADEQANIHSQLLNYFLELSERAELALHGPDQMEWYQRLTDERDNLRVALAHASRSGMSAADLEAGLSISAKLVDYWVASDYREGLRWSTEFIQNPASQNLPLARAKALITQGWLLWSMQQFEAIRSITQECLAVFRSYGDQIGEYDALILMGNMQHYAGDIEQRAEFARQALALARSRDDGVRQAFALFILGWDQRDHQRAHKYLEEAVVLFRQAGDWRFLAQALGVLGLTVLSNGDLASAEMFLDEAYEVNQRTNRSAMEYVLTGKAILCILRGEYGQARLYLQMNIDNLEKMGNRVGVLWGRARLGEVALREGSVAEAHQVLVDTIENFHPTGNKNGLAFAVDKMASLYVTIDKPDVAARLIGWSDATRKEIGDPRPRLELEDLDRDIAAIKAKIGADAYVAAYNTGRDLTLDDAVAFASGAK